MSAITFNKKRRAGLQRKYDTWRLVRACFAAYIQGKKPTPEKLRALTSLTWITKGSDNTHKVTLPALRTLTGKPLADCEFANLAVTLQKAEVAQAVVRAAKNRTGFVNLFNAYRNSCIDWFSPRKKVIYDLFDQAYGLQTDERANDIYAAIANLDGVGREGGGGDLPPENLLTSVIACLDPRKRCPIINGRNEVRLKLKARGVEQHELPDQFWAFVKLIHHGGITDAFMLDIVTVKELASVSSPVQKKTDVKKPPAKPKELPKKDENEIHVLRKATQSSYIKRHDGLTDRLRAYCRSNGKTVYEGRDNACRFDALIENYDGKGRDLLIEAKSSTDTAFCRMAAGQLFDYRRLLPGSAETDLAVLFPRIPGKHVLDFLGHVGIKALRPVGDTVIDLCSGSTLFP